MNWYYHGMRRGMADLESLPETQGAYLEMTALCYQVFGEVVESSVYASRWLAVR